MWRYWIIYCINENPHSGLIKGICDNISVFFWLSMGWVDKEEYQLLFQLICLSVSFYDTMGSTRTIAFIVSWLPVNNPKGFLIHPHLCCYLYIQLFISGILTAMLVFISSQPDFHWIAYPRKFFLGYLWVFTFKWDLWCCFGLFRCFVYCNGFIRRLTLRIANL